MSVVDYLLASHDDITFLSNFKILDFNEFSDHAPVFFAFLSQNHSKENTPSNVTRPEQKIFYDESKSCLFRSELVNRNDQLQRLNEHVNIGPVDSIVDSFTDYIYATAVLVYGKNIDINSKQKNTNFTSNKWFDKDCSEARNEFKHARNEFLRNKNPTNRKRFVTARTKYNRRKSNAKQKQKIKEGKNICDLAKKQPKKFWKSIKSKLKAKSPHSDSLTAEDLLNHFKTVFGGDTNIPPDPEHAQAPPPPEPHMHPELDAEFTEAELKEAVFHQKNNKSPGVDNLNAELFKISFDIISPFLLKLFNRLFQNAEYPRSWGEGIISPIFKSGNVDDAQNYRGITLINILAKIYSQLLVNRLTKWSEKEEKLSNTQFGFQKGKSTTDCIFTFFSIISKTLHAGDKLYCVFVDYEKAFDRIDRTLLWQKLMSENISSRFVRALSSMYQVVKACIRYKSSISQFFSSEIGLKQGDPSSPLLFMFFINDITQNINSDIESIFTIDEIKIFMLLYADDAVLFAKSPVALQSILNDLERYCALWGLKINVKKTKAMIFEKGRHTSYDFYINNTKLDLVSSFKYLGMHFFKNGNWHRAQKRIASHASYALHNLFGLFKHIELPISEKCKLFDTFVGSVLNYGGEILGLNEAKDIELIHSKFCRWILHVRKSTNLTGLYGELGRVPFIIQRKIRMINYWVKLLGLNDQSIHKKLYSMLKQDADNNISYNGSNWAFQIKSLLNELGLSYIWLQQNEFTIPVNLIKQRIFDNYYQSWYSNINNSSRLSMYSRYKHDFLFETYLDTIPDQKFRITLTKFRLSSHNLAIERGRFENIPRNDRICRCCNLHMVESEYHFLLVCPLYNDLRKKYFKNYFCRWPTLNKFDALMSNSSKSKTLSLSNFLYFAMKLRDSIQ